MATENNALKELEKSLIRDHETIAKKCGCGFASVLKAQQIISAMSEFAYRITVCKKKDGGIVLMYEPKDKMAVIDGVFRCREIAEKK